MEVPRSVEQIRLATGDELPAVIDVEQRSSVRFLDTPGLEHWVDDPTDLSDLEPALAREMVWVAVADGAIVGWCYASEVDDSLFVEQIDVVPEHGRRGIGGRLIDTVSREAGARGLHAVTLTTQANVAWNGPWYEKVGFHVVAPHERGPGLAAKLAHEAGRGFDMTHRIAMRRPVP